jgi:putative glycosyltransferase (TIGR04348 family)
VLTGTDLYRDLPEDLDARDSLAIADRLVVLQEEALCALPREHRRKARVVYQSARALRPAAKPGTRFHCVFVGHLREEKDPMTVVRGWARLPLEPSVHLTLIGDALDQALAQAVDTVALEDPRVRWLGARPHGWTRQAIKRAHLLIVPSRMEGGANVIAEAVTAGTPVLASRVPGNIGMLGRGYRGYFPAGDAARLAQLIQLFRDDAQFRRALMQDCRARRVLFAPARERAALLQLMQEVWRGAQPGDLTTGKAR